MTTQLTTEFQTDEAFARSLDAADPLAKYREQFLFPTSEDGTPLTYLCGNSLGLQPKTAAAMVTREMEDWAKLAVNAHLGGRNPWYTYHEQFRDPIARVVGAEPREVVVMNALTVNLHLLLTTFYQPTKTRFRIIMEAPAFPSDTYALKTHLQTRGLDPAESLIIVNPREGEHTLRTEDIEAVIEEQGDSLALLWIGGINFLTGQAMDMARLTKAAHAVGAVAGFDLAHAAGNLDLRLHDWEVDFAVWCSYKYLNAGPGAPGGVFIHEKHAKNTNLPRYGGWWGNDPNTRFQLHLLPEFIPRDSADAWQISNPPILSLAPLRAALDIFDEATMPALRKKSLALTEYLRWLLEQNPQGNYEIITPREPESHGCQLSILINQNPKERHTALARAGVTVDFREPNVIRVAPAPLYNSFLDVWKFVQVLSPSMNQ